MLRKAMRKAMKMNEEAPYLQCYFHNLLTKAKRRDYSIIQ